MQNADLSKDEYVKMAVEAGVAPLELRFFPIVNCDYGYPVAYRTETVIHSVLLGDLPEAAYTYVSDRRPCGKELLQHSLQHAIAALSQFDRAERKVVFLSVRCPAEFAEDGVLYDCVAKVLQKNPSLDPGRLCLEFSASLMERNAEKTRRAMLDMKLLKIKTMVTGCGRADFPITGLLNVSPDLVMIDPAMTAYAGDRNKPRVLGALVSYIRSMGMEAVAEGTEEDRRNMHGSDCIGFLTSGNAGISLDEALARGEEDV